MDEHEIESADDTERHDTVVRAVSLLHPSGRPSGILLLDGSGERKFDLPVQREADGAGADVVLILPEWRGALGVEEIRSRLGQVEARGGLVYAVTDRRNRTSTRKWLRGLRERQTFIHAGPTTRPSLIAPLEAPALAELILESGNSRWGRAAAQFAARSNFGRGAYEHFAPGVGYLGGRGASRAGEWLRKLVPEVPARSALIVRPSWRGILGSTVVSLLPDAGGSSGVIAKVAHDPARGAALHREAENLRLLAPSAGAEGAAVPKLFGVHQLDDLTILIESQVEGVPAANILRRNKSRGIDLIERIGTWLHRWHEASLTRRKVTRQDVESWVERPLVYLLRSELVTQDYAQSVRELASRALGSELPLVVAHRDLTAFNLLLDGERIGVIDWEEAAPEQLPLTDFFYAATDLTMVAHRLDRHAAFVEAFGRRGRYTSATGAIVEQTATALGLEPWVPTLALHVCWLHHAFNETYREPKDVSQQFLKVLHTLAGGGRDLQPDLSREAVPDNG